MGINGIKYLDASSRARVRRTNGSSSTTRQRAETTLAQGKLIYDKNCAHCHGEKGDGNGFGAPHLSPAPRDFVAAQFKFRTTSTGALPTDEDLFRIVSRGLNGTGMPPWQYLLTEQERWAVVDYIKTFSPRFAQAAPKAVKLPAAPTRPYVPGEPLVPCYAPQGERFPDNSVDMGTGFDCFDTLSHTDDPRVTGEQRANRDLLRGVLAERGFVNLPEEWWHFTFQPEPFPDRYFDFPVSRDALPGR